MRIVRNIGHVKRRKRLGRWSAVVGFFMLASTFALVFFPEQIMLAYVLLIVGFILFNFGMQQLGKWSNTPRSPRNDLAIDERLRDLSDKYALLHYIRLGKRQVVEHALVHPGGVLVIAARDVPGRVVGKGNRWRRKGAGVLRLFGMSGPQLGNPSFETDKAVQEIEQVLKEGQAEFDVSGVIVFTNSMVQLEATETDYPAITLDRLPEFVRELEVDPAFKNSDRDALVALLAKGEELERSEPTRTRRPVRVKRRTASERAQP
jgi:hypothetical protein